jgi:tetraacyldisaccharide 4'-kinase
VRAEIERWLNQIWYGQQTPPLWLRGLVPLYRGAFLLDRYLKHRRPSDLDGKPILVIGNLTVGGSGKTPLVIRLCRVLQDSGLKVGVASRGYGRRSRSLQVVTAESDPDLSGDEPLLIAQRAKVPVVVANDRSAAVRALFARGVDLVITDDGLQHHRLPRSMEVCVIDGSRGFGNGRQLPAGPLREPWHRLQQFDHVVLNGETYLEAKLPMAVKMTLVPGMLHAIDQKLSWRLSQFNGCRASAVAGIANPDRFFNSLEQAGLLLDRHVWPDHHAYTPGDFANLNPDYPIIMTEKDAVKCRSLGLRNAWYLAVDAHLPGAFELELLTGMMQAVASSRQKK